MQRVGGKVERSGYKGRGREDIGSGMKNREIGGMTCRRWIVDSGGATRGDMNGNGAGWGITATSYAHW